MIAPTSDTDERVHDIHMRRPLTATVGSAPSSAAEIDLREEQRPPPAVHEGAEVPEPSLLADADGWRAHARCNDGSGQLAHLFFSEELQDIARAKHICATCPALIPCLEGALERREPWGVWGGQLFLNGKILATKRRRGRPPKQPRPEDQLPEIPIPEHLRGVAVIRIA